jgi:glutamate--cysteine ligase
MRLLDLFILSCLIDESPQCDALGQQRNNTNLQRVVSRGREPGLTLLSAGGSEVTLSELAEPTLASMAEIAGWFDCAIEGDGNYLKTVAEAQQKISDPSLTPSARILSEMQKDGMSYRQLAWRYSRKWHAKHLNQSLDRSTLASLEEQAHASLERQRELEASQQQPFEDYLAKFYSQY